ncbi:MAG: adenosylmethionine--8-amino-7-oxononanoate transaminase [Cenarchaeum sp. SB0664_bin_35]|nr:adenosylmethionine--8-amino-7-oxononanoate transaminase [Cenarchaeum sp. SB0664_bin_35]
MRSYVWHPNTQMSEWDSFQKIVSGDGMWLQDSTGHRMLDAVSSMWCNVWGHSESELINALNSQARTLPHSSLFNITHTPAESLAECLVGICPGMEHVFYTDDGSTAMESAFKMAVQYWKNQGCPKHMLASLSNGYHGDTVGAMSAGYSDAFFGAYYSMVPQSIRIPTPNHGVDDWNDTLNHISETLESNQDIAALVMESGAQTAGGVVIYPDAFQDSVSQICHKHDTLLVVDEVATGLGRLSHMAEYAALQSRPDIAVYSKMLTAGYMPLAATLATDKVYDAFLGDYSESLHLFHGHTFSGNPLGAAVAHRNLELYEERQLLQHVRRISDVFADGLKMISDAPRVLDVRYKGLLAGIDVDITHNAQSANYTIYQIGRKNDIYLRTLGDTILVVPPLAISSDELSQIITGVLNTILAL